MHQYPSDTALPFLHRPTVWAMFLTHSHFIYLREIRHVQLKDAQKSEATTWRFQLYDQHQHEERLDSEATQERTRKHVVSASLLFLAILSL